MKQEPSQLTANKIQEVIQITSKFYGLPAESLVSNSRRDEFIVPRHIAMSICREIYGFQFAEIGHCFNRDHTTVMNAAQVMQYRLRNEQDVVVAYGKILAEVISVPQA